MSDNIPFGYNDDGTPDLGYLGRALSKEKWAKIYEERMEKERKEREYTAGPGTPEDLREVLRYKEKQKNNE